MQPLSSQELSLLLGEDGYSQLLGNSGNITPALKELDKTPFDWPEIVPLKNLGCPKPFPEDALPPSLGRIFAHLAETVQVPIELCISVALPVIATAIGRRAAIQLPTHREPSPLWGCCVLEPGGRKSAIFKILTAPLMAHERELQKNWKEKWRGWRARADIAEERIKKGRRAQDKGVIEEARKVLDEEPHCPHLWTEDATSESIRKILPENGSLGVFSAEGGSVLGGFGRYSGNKEADLGIWLGGHAGDPGKATRVGSKSSTNLEQLLSVGLTAQFEILQSIGSDRTAKGRGLLDRFMWLIPPDPRGHRSYENINTVSATITTEWDDHIGKILKTEIPAETPMVPVSPPASILWKAFATDIEKRQLPGGDLRQISGWASKLAGLAGRLALSFHFGEGRSTTDPISEPTMTWALNLSSHLIDHAKVALLTSVGDADIMLAEAILWHIRDKKLNSLSSRDILRQNWGGCSSAEAVGKALQKLCDHGYLVEGKPEPTSRVGRPRAPIFKINPAILTDKTDKIRLMGDFVGFVGHFEGVAIENSCSQDLDGAVRGSEEEIVNAI